MKGRRSTYLRHPIVVVILRRQKQRTGDRSIEERRLSFASIGDDMLKNRAGTCGIAPERDMTLIATKQSDLSYTNEYGQNGHTDGSYMVLDPFQRETLVD